MTSDGAGVFQAVDQFHGAVMLDEEARRDLSNSRLHVIRQAMDCEQKLMLLGLDAVFLCGSLAEVEESADLAAELGEVAVLLTVKVLGGPHIYIVPRYKYGRRSALLRDRMASSGRMVSGLQRFSSHSVQDDD